MTLKEIKELKKELKEVKDLQADITKNTARRNQEGKLGVQAQKELNGLKEREKKLAEDIADAEGPHGRVANIKKTISLTKSFNKIATNSQKLLLKSFGIQTNESELLKTIQKEKTKGNKADQNKIKALNAAAELEQEFLNDLKEGNFVVEEAESKLQALKEEFEDMGDSFATAVDDSFKNFPKIQKDADKISNALETEIPFLDQLEQMKKKAKDFGNMLLNPTTAALAVVGFIVKKIVDFAKKAKEVRQDLGIVATDSVVLSAQMSAAGASVTALSGDAQKAQDSIKALAQSMSRIPNLSLQTSRQFGAIVALSGATAEDMATILELQTLTTAGSSEKAVQDIKSVEALSDQAGVLKSKVFGDVADSAKTQAFFFGKSAKEIAKAAIQMRKLGVSASVLDTIAESILDLETSIGKEFEVQALFGKTINLNKARKLAMDRDGIGLGKEIRRQLGGQFDLNKASFAQVKSIKEMFNLTQEQMQKLIDGQDIFNSTVDDAGEKAKSNVAKYAILGGVIIGTAAAIVGALSFGAGTKLALKGAAKGAYGGFAIGGTLGALGGAGIAALEDGEGVKPAAVGSLTPAVSVSSNDEWFVSKGEQSRIDLDSDARGRAEQKQLEATERAEKTTKVKLDAIALAVNDLGSKLVRELA